MKKSSILVGFIAGAFLQTGCSRQPPIEESPAPSPTPLAAPASPRSGALPPSAYPTPRAAERDEPAKSPSVSSDEREVLSLLGRLRSQCDNTAWVLWYSNDYDDWRAGETRQLSMNYSYSIPPEPPPTPAFLPDEIRARFDELVPDTVRTIVKAGEDFHDMATYIDAGDYEDDKFKKGDAINQRLLAAGEKCQRLTRQTEDLHSDYANQLIDEFRKDPKTATLTNQLQADLALVQKLATEMSRGDATDRDAVEEQVGVISRRVEEWKTQRDAGKIVDADKMEPFYLGIMENDVAVKMRKLLRESRDDPKEWEEAIADRPRSASLQLRGEAFIQMPGAALRILE